MVSRFNTKNKGRAFSMRQYLINQTGDSWKVAGKLRNRIAFDIDSKDKGNLNTVIEYYSKLFGDFIIHETTNGYHLYTKTVYNDEWLWYYDTCRVLCPILQKSEILTYLGKVNKWYGSIIKESYEEQWDRETYVSSFPIRFKKSELYCGVGDFDMIFSVMVILKGYYCIRISRKADELRQ